MLKKDFNFKNSINTYTVQKKKYKTPFQLSKII